jgi:hypothetical protein
MARSIPAQRPGPPKARQVPRAPLPARGVTSYDGASRTSSEGAIPPSSLLRAHAPDQIPPRDFGCPSSTGSLQVVVSPCCKMALPDVISARLSLDAWTLSAAVYQMLLPITSPAPSAFPQSPWVGYPQRSTQRLQSGGDFAVAVIPSCSGLEVCCHPGRSHRRVQTRGSCGVYVRAEHRSLPSCASDMLAVRTGN